MRGCGPMKFKYPKFSIFHFNLSEFRKHRSSTCLFVAEAVWSALMHHCQDIMISVVNRRFHFYCMLVQILPIICIRRFTGPNYRLPAQWVVVRFLTSDMYFSLMSVQTASNAAASTLSTPPKSPCTDQKVIFNFSNSWKDALLVDLLQLQINGIVLVTWQRKTTSPEPLYLWMNCQNLGRVQNGSEAPPQTHWNKQKHTITVTMFTHQSIAPSTNRLQNPICSEKKISLTCVVWSWKNCPH